VNKVLLGVVLGAILGAIDGMTAWFTPEVRAQLAGIVIGSTVKGIIAGVLIGVFARRFSPSHWALCSASPWACCWPSSSPRCSTATTFRSCCPAGWWVFSSGTPRSGTGGCNNRSELRG